MLLDKIISLSDGWNTISEIGIKRFLNRIKNNKNKRSNRINKG